MNSANLDFKIVIPARFSSTRLPGKPLLDLGGKPMMVRVAEQAAKTSASEIIIATDHLSVLEAAKAHGLKALMTREDHPSGTDRLAEIVEKCGWADDTFVVNVQGDEPLIDPLLITQTAEQLAKSGAAIATLAHPIKNAADFFAPNIVKVICAQNGNALYFSRAPIPYARDFFAQNKNALPPAFTALRHVGLYAYRASFLRAYAKLAPSEMEQFESLEQLRALWHGDVISVAISDHLPANGVDTPEDARKMQAHFAKLK